MELMENLSRNVKLLRNAKDISQSELAEKCGVCLATINRIEKGHRIPDFDLVCKIADALGTTTEKLRENLSDTAAIVTGKRPLRCEAA